MSTAQETTLYQLSTTGKVKQWTLSRSDNVITTTWGYVDGAIQTTEDIITGKNIGRSNETSNAAQAALEFDRQVKEKKHRGSVESLTEAQSSRPVLDDDFFNDPPVSLALPKPANSIADKKKYAGTFMVQRKLDGCRAHVFIGTDNNICIKSRTMKEDKTLHFPNIVSQIKKLGLTNTVLDGEMVVLHENGSDDFDAMTSIWRSDVEKSLGKSKNANVIFIVFDMPFHETKDMLATKTYRERHAAASILVKKAKSKSIKMMETLDLSVKEAEALAIQSGWEGLVLWNPEAKHTNAWTITGKPKRPSNFCFKDKVKQDFDVIVDEWEYGKGKNKAVLGKWVGAHMLCPSTGRKIAICDVGGGLSDDQRSEFMTLDYPVVIKVECDKMNPNGSLRFPVFKSLHEAKTPEECMMDEAVFKRLTEIRYL